MSWLKTVTPIAAIFSCRMLGLFMLIPIFTIYSSNLAYATPVLTGLALGAYGFTQGVLQIPFGIISDKLGRKNVIAFGLILFVAGSILGAVSESIYGVIAARVLQGSGAVGSVLMALMADLIPDKDRAKSMAVVGMSIGLSFSVAMVISPLISHNFGLSGIFYISAILGGLAIFIIFAAVANPEKITTINLTLLPSVLKKSQLYILDISIFLQHFILTATFFEIPKLLAKHTSYQWRVYLFVMLAAFICSLPFIAIAERKALMKRFFMLALAVVAGMQIVLFYHKSYALICISLWLYFSAFNFLEACLPALIAKFAPVYAKGTAMGIYSSCQFLGIFAGGVSAGFIFKYLSGPAIFVVNGTLAFIWLFLITFYLPKKSLS